jgi:uncharacterized protein YbjT (DUF2867 family)
MSNILILGGTGFVGRHLCEQLQRAGHTMTVPTRQLKTAARVQHLPGVTVQVTDINQPDNLARLVAGHDAVINLVAILHGNAKAFRQVHVALVESLIAACEAAGVKRVVHMSALGANAESNSLYQQTKAQAEALLDASALDVTILRPSVIFGADDRFLNLFARMQRVLPVVPLAGADCRFQPVWVEDVARAIVRALGMPGTVGQTIEIAGPQVYTLRQLVQTAGNAIGCPRTVIGLPVGLAYFQALFMELLPGVPLLSTDNISAMETDNVASPADQGAHTLASLGLTPSALEEVVPTYLHATAGTLAPRERLVELRANQR